jgi:hypothetical protein
LPNPAIIPKPGKVASMIWIVKHFQTLLMSALIAVADTFAWLNPYPNRFMLNNQADGEGMAS